MKVQVREIRLKPLSGAFAEYLRITASYHQGGSYIRDYKVEYWLQVGQALGLDPPHTDNHASDGSGGAGEGVKAKEEEKNFNDWKNKYATELGNVTIDSGSRTVNNYHVTDEEMQSHVIKKANNKAKSKDNKLTNFRNNQTCLEDKGYTLFDPDNYDYSLGFPQIEICVCCQRKFLK